MEPSPTTPTPPANTGARVLLGIFILGQLFFLAATNFLGLFSEAREELPEDVAGLIDPIVPDWPKKKGGHGQIDDLFDLLEKVSTRYGQITGQSQSWCLFAPDIGDQCVFPALELQWEEDPQNGPTFSRPLAVLAAQDPLQTAALWGAVRRYPLPRLSYEAESISRHLAGLASRTKLDAALFAAAIQQAPGLLRPTSPAVVLSVNEPQNLHRFFRVGHFRLRRYECNLAVTLRALTYETYPEMLKRWHERIEKLFRNDRDALFAYMRWRLEVYRKAHPEVPMPSQVIFLVRRFRIAGPDEEPPHYRGPFVEAVARWQPHVTWQTDYFPVEMFNHVTQRFERVRK